MSMIKAVICFGICHLIVGQQIYNCDVASGADECVTTTNSSDSQMKVSCHYNSIVIRGLDPDSANPLRGHDNITSPSNSCIHDLIGRKVTVKVDVSENNITTFPDNYFCHLNASEIAMKRNLLNDTTKLGFSSLENCTVRCSIFYIKLSLDDNNFGKVSNGSFCGLPGLHHLRMDNCQLKQLENDAFARLKYLTVLSLRYNNISILSAGVFRRQRNTLNVLYLSHNKLDSSSIKELMNLTRLQKLDLSQNQIDVIPNGFFDRMGRLRYLYLDGNCIKSLLGALTGLRIVQELVMSNNNISHISYKDFEHFVNIMQINLDNNPIDIFEPDALTNCVNMDVIRLTNASLSTVPDFVSKSEHLRELHLSQNNISSIKVGTFDKARNIDKIDLSYNRLADITNLFSKCTVKHLVLDHNRITKIDFNDFSIYLETLSIAHNHIHTIHFDPTTKQEFYLKLANLSHNHLNDLHNLSLPLTLVRLYVDNNNISAMSYSDAYIEFIESLNMRQKWRQYGVYLRNNSFKTFDERIYFPLKDSIIVDYFLSGNPLECSCENHWLLTSDFVIDRDSLTCQPQSQQLAKQPAVPLKDDLKDVYDSNSCRCEAQNDSDVDPVKKTWIVKCPTQFKCYDVLNKSVIRIDCSSINITNLSLTQTVDFNMTQELYVYFDNNPISRIHSNSLNGLHSAVELYLNWADLSEIADGSFDLLTVLKVLNLEHNNLGHISNKIFKNLNSLTHLFLSHNKIKTIGTNAFPSQLETLRLDNNQLVNYHIWELDKLTQLKKLSVHANQWSCECNYIAIWLQKKSSSSSSSFSIFAPSKESQIIDQIDQIMCIQTNDTQLNQMPLMTFNALHCKDTPLTDPNTLPCKKLSDLLNSMLNKG